MGSSPVVQNAPEENPIGRMIRVAIRRLSQRNETTLPIEDIAREAEVPLEVARSLFADRDSLLRTVLETLLQVETDYLGRRAAAEDLDNPAGQGLAMAHAYMDWAFDHPDEFRVLQDPLMQRVLGEAKLRRYNEAIRALAMRLGEAAADSGQLRRGFDQALVVLGARALGYGLARLEVDGHLKFWADSDPEGRRALMHAVLNQFADAFFVDWSHGHHAPRAEAEAASPDQPIRSEA